MGSRTLDALVVGAGPAGASAAWQLARRGARVRILDAAEFPRSKPCGDAVSPGAVPLLREMGIDEKLDSIGAARIRGWRMRSPDGFWFQGRYADRAAASPPWGYAVPRAELDALLLEAAVGEGAEFLPRHRAVELRDEGGRFTATIARDARGRERTHEARMIVGADGLRSRVARQLGRVRRGRRRRLALVARFATQLAGTGATGMSPGEYGEMRLARGGLVGMAPIGGARWNVTLVVPVAEAGAIRGDAERFYRDRLTAFGVPREISRAVGIGPLEITGPFELSPARVHAPGVLLAGDAAGYFDPFTGQGVYRALVTGRLAAHAVTTALATPAGERAARRRYEKELRRVLLPGRRVQRIVDAVICRPRAMNGLARILARRPALADLLVDVTGDRLSPGVLASPGRLARTLFAAGYKDEQDVARGTEAAWQDGTDERGAMRSGQYRAAERAGGT